MDPKVVMYAVYLAISIGLTVWVGATLSRAGALFLEDTFADTGLAMAVNRLLVVGFYLLNFGFVSIAMRDGSAVSGTASVMEGLSIKVGMVLLVLGAVHFFNLSMLGRYRRSRLRQAAPLPPLPPSAMIAAPALVRAHGPGAQATPAPVGAGAPHAGPAAQPPAWSRPSFPQPVPAQPAAWPAPARPTPTGTAPASDPDDTTGGVR